MEEISNKLKIIYTYLKKGIMYIKFIIYVNILSSHE